jgi:hypothetical protein
MDEFVAPPRRPRSDFVYSSLFYSTHVKHIFEASKQILIACEIEFQSVSLRNQITREVMKWQSPEIIQEVEDEVEAQFTAAKLKYSEYRAEKPSDDHLLE